MGAGKPNFAQEALNICYSVTTQALAPLVPCDSTAKILRNHGDLNQLNPRCPGASLWCSFATFIWQLSSGCLWRVNTFVPRL